jgi:hypothetical protein
MLAARLNPNGGGIGVVYHRRKLTDYDSELMYVRLRTDSMGWETPIVVSRNTSHDQWDGALDYDTNANYLVTYYDFDRPNHAGDFPYRVFATKLFPDGFHPDATDVLLYDNICLDPQCDSDVTKNTLYSPPPAYAIGEYQDVWFWFGYWNAASVYSPRSGSQGDSNIIVSRATP